MFFGRFIDVFWRRAAGAAVRATAGAAVWGAAWAFVLALPGAAGAAQCDYSGFEKPCRAGGGEYRVLIPEGEGPFPAMVYLYGSGGRSITIANHPVFEAAIAGRGYALIVPSANMLTYAGGVRDTGWALRNEPERGRDEVAFVRAVIEDAARRFPLDRAQVLLAGQSRGGFLIWEIACHHPDVAAAYTVHGAGYLGRLPDSCEAPVRFLHTHGRDDPVVPVAGRSPPPGFIGPSIPPMLETLRLLARANRCEADPGEATPYLGFERRPWSGCAEGSRLDLMLHEGGHVMPASWFRAVLDWFEEPLPEAEEAAPVVRRIGDGLPAATSGTRTVAEPGARSEGRFKAPPAPGAKALVGQ